MAWLAGHNELDQPMFTQPAMYRAIGAHPTTSALYAQRLVAEGTVDSAYCEQEEARIWEGYNEAFMRDGKHDDKGWLESRWSGFKMKGQLAMQQPTGLPIDELKRVGLASCSVPEGFNVHKALKRILNNRAKSIEAGEGLDFATAEAMAFGSLLVEDIHVRMSGQDVERGTFSHRHAVLHDQVTEVSHTPLQHVGLREGHAEEHSEQAAFTIANSHLSEYAVLGFELGYSMNHPQQLVIWEAQFGDFANTAQCIIDQFLSSGEMKWKRQSGAPSPSCTLLLSSCTYA